MHVNFSASGPEHPILSRRAIMVFQLLAVGCSVATAGFFVFSNKTLNDTFANSDLCTYKDPADHSYHDARYACRHGELNYIVFPARTTNQTVIDDAQCAQMLNQFCTNYMLLFGFGIGSAVLAAIFQVAAGLGLYSAWRASRLQPRVAAYELVAQPGL